MASLSALWVSPTFAADMVPESPSSAVPPRAGDSMTREGRAAQAERESRHGKRMLTASLLGALVMVGGYALGRRLQRRTARR
ncbi:MAG: hypothetical protein R3B13_22795 [Polyangiaceae bacterium]